MIKKIARIVNLILWLGLLFGFILNDFKIFGYGCGTNNYVGPFQTLAIIFGVFAVIVAVVGMLGGGQDAPPAE